MHSKTEFHYWPLFAIFYNTENTCIPYALLCYILYRNLFHYAWLKKNQHHYHRKTHFFNLTAEQTTRQPIKPSMLNAIGTMAELLHRQNIKFVIRVGDPLKKQTLLHACAGIKTFCSQNTIWVSFVCVEKCLQTTDLKDIFVGLMGLWPSCVKTARRHAAVRLFVITEQVIYICIFSSAFDTPLDFFGRLLLKQTCAAWYATHTGSPSGHHQWRLKSDEEKERVKRRRKRERGKKWKRKFFTQRTREGTAFPKGVHVWTTVFWFEL